MQIDHCLILLFLSMNQMVYTLAQLRVVLERYQQSNDEDERARGRSEFFMFWGGLNPIAIASIPEQVHCLYPCTFSVVFL